MHIDCPQCGKNNDIDGDDLPELACDDKEYECIHCDHTFNIGWYGTVELR